MMARAGLTFTNRVEISTATKAAWGIRDIAHHLGRCPSVASREIRQNTSATRGYQAVTTDVRAQRRRSRPPAAESREGFRAAGSSGGGPRNVLAAEREQWPLAHGAADPTVERMDSSPDAHVATVSGETTYQYINAIPAENSPGAGSSCSPSAPAAGPASPAEHRRADRGADPHQ